MRTGLTQVVLNIDPQKLPKHTQTELNGWLKHHIEFKPISNENPLLNQHFKGSIMQILHNGELESEKDETVIIDLAKTQPPTLLDRIKLSINPYSIAAAGLWVIFGAVVSTII